MQYKMQLLHKIVKNTSISVAINTYIRIHICINVCTSLDIFVVHHVYLTTTTILTITSCTHSQTYNYTSEKLCKLKIG